MGYKLPLLTERSLNEAEAGRSDALQRFEREIHQHVTETKRPVTCSKGCDHCCYHPVTISILEGMSLYLWLAGSYLWTADRKNQFAKHSKSVWGLSPEIWMLSMTPCPLLEDHLCRAYEGRPAVCRATVSTGDPLYCHPHHFGLDVTGLVPRHSFYEAIVGAEKRLLRRHAQILFQLPISTAVLYGEMVCKGELDLEDSGPILTVDYQKLHAHV